MNAIQQFTIKAALVFAGLAMLPSCSAESKDSKDHAEDVNEEKFNKEGEKDADRVVELYSINMYELRASENATTKASTAEVKKLAAMMIESHTKMKAELERMAAAKSITLPTDLSDDHRKKMDNLMEKTGLDYDKEYVDQMKNKHKDAINTLEKTAEKAEDAELKQMASTALPEMRSHLEMCESTQNMVKDMKDDNHNNNVNRDKDKDRHTDHNH